MYESKRFWVAGDQTVRLAMLLSKNADSAGFAMACRCEVCNW